MDFVSLNFTDERVKKVLAMLPAIRASQANVLISGPRGIGKSALARHILGAVEYTALNVFELTDDFDFCGCFSLPSHSTFLIEDADKLTANQQKSLYDILGSPGLGRPIRIVSTSRAPLKNLVQKGLFREDLYYRLTVLNLELPALVQRLGDIDVLANHLVGVFTILHKKISLTVSAEALEKLKIWHWPGNIRELENVLERAVILAAGGTILSSHIVIENNETTDENSDFAGMSLSQVEQKLILQTLEMTEQNRTRAAEILGISIRTLRNKINEYREAGLV